VTSVDGSGSIRSELSGRRTRAPDCRKTEENGTGQPFSLRVCHVACCRASPEVDHRFFTSCSRSSDRTVVRHATGALQAT
jgi:hypothetical protein